MRGIPLLCLVDLCEVGDSNMRHSSCILLHRSSSSNLSPLFFNPDIPYSSTRHLASLGQAMAGMQSWSTVSRVRACRQDNAPHLRQPAGDTRRWRSWSSTCCELESRNKTRSSILLFIQLSPISLGPRRLSCE